MSKAVATYQAAGDLYTYQPETLAEPLAKLWIDYAVANGLPWDAALAALTANPAAILALDEGFGTIEPGSPADLVIWSGDPLEVTTWAESVVLGGKPIDMVSRQTLLRDRYLPQAPGKPRAYIENKQ